jgi:hypothetical protein
MLVAAAAALVVVVVVAAAVAPATLALVLLVVEFSVPEVKRVELSVSFVIFSVCHFISCDGAYVLQITFYTFIT